MAFVAFPVDSLKTFLISVPVMVVCEWLFVFFTNVPHGKDGKILPFPEWVKYAWGKGSVNNILAPIVSGMIFALTLPPSASWYHVLVGAIVGIVIGKLVFGGTGNNIFNPALVGMLFSKLCFGAQWNLNQNSWMVEDVCPVPSARSASWQSSSGWPTFSSAGRPIGGSSSATSGPSSFSWGRPASTSPFNTKGPSPGSSSWAMSSSRAASSSGRPS